MNDLLEMAHALGRAVTETELYRSLQQAKAEWERDTEAQRLERESKALAEEMKTRIGSRLSPAEMQRMITLSEAINERESVRRYNEASDAFEALRGDIYQILALYLGGNTAGCAGCAGCGK